MIAGLPMYDLPWTAQANDAVWASLGARLRETGWPAPERLARGMSPDALWRDPALIFGQTCGYPYWFALRERVEPIATPVYAFEGCEGADHCSFLIARVGDARSDLAAFRGARAAINARDSNSGMNLFRAAVAPLAGGRAFFASVILTGAHAASVASVASGEADIAAIDCVTFGQLRVGRPELIARVTAIGRTAMSPGLPFIASLALAEAARAAVRAGLFAALADPELAGAWRRLGIVGAEVPPPAAYACIEQLEQSAARAGYRELE